MPPSEAAGSGPVKLVQMANQIADNFAIQPEAVAVAAIARHIVRYWTPRMRRDILAHAAAGGVGLDALTRRALGAMAPPPPPCQAGGPLR